MFFVSVGITRSKVVVGTSTGARRVGVVESREALRLGIAAVVARDPEMSCPYALSHDDVPQFAHALAGCDAVLVSGTDAQRIEDQFPCVEALDLIRGVSDPRRPTLAIVYSDHWRHPALRWRAREAGADVVVALDDVTHGAGVGRVARWRRDECVLGRVGSSEALAALGVSSRSQVNAFVARVRDLGLDKIFAEEAPEEIGSRRRIRAVRGELAAVGRIHAVNTDGIAPRRDQDLPSIRQLQRLYRWATQIHPFT